MSYKAIEFDLLMDVCKHNSDGKCSDEDNFSGDCHHAECPVWNDLTNSEIEL